MRRPEASRIAVTSRGIESLNGISQFLGAPICRAPRFLRPRNIRAVAGWGLKSSGLQAEKVARRLGVPVIHLEDGFLRSVFPGRKSRPYSIVQDGEGIYYDSTRKSSLETMLNSEESLLDGIAEDVTRARQLILHHQLSKYNHAPLLDPLVLQQRDQQRVLVVDQTAGDSSVTYGAADGVTFQQMLESARRENPSATIYIKTHPEVSSGVKRGYLGHISSDAKTVILHQPINPLSLVLHMDHVYTVTSTMGFEGLLAGRKVSCFGMPWYAGWGLTNDRQTCGRRTRKRSTDELFAAAYFHYSTYLDPRTEKIGTIFDVIDWLVEQRT